LQTLFLVGQRALGRVELRSQNVSNGFVHLRTICPTSQRIERNRPVSAILRHNSRPSRLKKNTRSAPWDDKVGKSN
jgi:hypothetical protein